MCFAYQPANQPPRLCLALSTTCAGYSCLQQELLEKLEKAEASLKQTELDLKSEQNVRRTLQAEVTQEKAKQEALVQQQEALVAQQVSHDYSRVRGWTGQLTKMYSHGDLLC